MRSLGIATVKNEDDVIETFVRYNVRHLDALVVLEHGSSDRTAEILGALVREGLPLHVVEGRGVAFRQSERMTELLHAVARRFDPDWVFALDADEFLAAPRGLAPLDDVPRGRTALLPWRTYVPTAADPRDEPNPLRRLRHRRAVESPQYYKVAIPRRLWRDPDLVIETGNHAVRDLAGTRAPGACVPGLELAHLPVRSSAQVLAKICVNWLAFLAEPRREEGVHTHTAEMYERFHAAEFLDAEALQALAVGYAHGEPGPIEQAPLPVPADLVLRHTTVTPTPALAKVVRFAESLARECAAREAGEPLDAGRALDAARRPLRRGLWRRLAGS